MKVPKDSKLYTRVGRNIPPYVFEQMERLNFRTRGNMLDTLLHEDYHSRVWWIEANNVVLSWSITVPISDNKFLADFYTRADYRRKGLARRLLNKMITTLKVPSSHIVVRAHDEVSNGFFQRVAPETGITVKVSDSLKSK